MRRWLLAGVAIVVVALGAALAFLVPVHLQVRAVDTALPGEAELLALRDDPDGPVAVHYVLTSRQDTHEGGLGHHSIVVRYADGRLFVVDAGMDAGAALAFGETVRSLGVSDADAEVLGTLAERLGPAAARVAGMGFTHLHIDHVQGVVDFCERVEAADRVRVQTATQAAEHNFNTARSAALLEASCLTPRLVAGDRLTLLEDFPGIGVFTLGGHTPGSTLWAIGLGERVLLLSGDITNSFAEIEEDRGKGFLYSYVFVPEHTGRTAELRAWLRDLDRRPDFSVVVSHDADRTAALLPAFGAP